jgi:hypothetical protein
MYNPQVSNIGGSGRVESIDYVNTSSSVTINAGSIVVINGLAYFAAADILPLALGSLVYSGGAWCGNKDTSVFTLGAKVFWNPTGTPVVGTASSGAFSITATGTFCGYCVMTPSTALPAATGDQFVYFVKAGGAAGAGTNAGLSLAFGQTTTVTASDTIVTGLSTVVGVVATLDAAPIATCAYATASIGNQSGAPAAGSFLLETWEPTTPGAAGNPTPVAATTFGKKVNWIAFGY